MGRHFRDRFHLNFGGDEQETENYEHERRRVRGTCRVQAVRSVSDWSHGVLTERSIQNACAYHCAVGWLELTLW